MDDDPKTLRYVRDALAGSEYAPLVTGDPEEVSGLIRSERPRLVLLDLMLPGTDGIELMERIPELADLPVIFISGYGRDETIARALEAGAARLHRQAVLADGADGADPGRPAQAGRARALPAGRPGDPLRGTPGERGRPSGRADRDRVRAAPRALRNAGRVSTYEALLRQVWGGRHSGDTELVRTFVKKLRRKLGDDAASPAYIVNERGVGYRMARPGDA